MSLVHLEIKKEKKRASVLSRLGMFVVFLLLCTQISGCARERSGDYLAYEREQGSYRLSIEWAGARYDAMLSTGDQLILEFREPSTLSDCKFVRDEQGRVLARIGSYEEMLDDDCLAAEIFAFFSLSEGDFLSTSHEKISGEQVSIVTYGKDITLYLARDNSPLKFVSPSCVAVVVRE